MQWRKDINTYLLLMSAAVRASFQYRANIMLVLVGGILYQCIGLAFIGVVASQFGGIGGWSIQNLALLYGLRLTAHAMWTVPCGQLFNVDTIVRSGELDRYLVRPAGVLTQLMTRRVSILVLGDLIGGVALLATAMATSDLAISFPVLAYLIAALIGGALTEFSIQLVIASLAFRLLSTRTLRLTIDSIISTFAGYPLAVFPSAARFGLTFVLPLAFIAYFPATVLTGRQDELFVPPMLATLAPLLGVVSFLLSLLVWRRELRQYVSSGH